MIKINKFLIIAVALFVIAIIPIRVEAVSNVFSAKLKLVDNKIDETGYLYVDLDINVNYVLNGVQGEIFYDKSKLQLLEISENDRYSSFNNIDYSEYSSFISFISTSGKKNNFTICSLTFKVTDEYVLGDELDIEIKNIKGVNDTIGIGNKISVKTAGVMKINGILIDNEIVNNNEYITNKEKVNVVVNLENGRVLSGDGLIYLKVGTNVVDICIEDEKNNKQNIVINVIRNSDNTQINNNDNNKNGSRSGNPKTFDYIIKYVISLAVSLLSLFLLLIYNKKCKLK